MVTDMRKIKILDLMNKTKQTLMWRNNLVVKESTRKNLTKTVQDETMFTEDVKVVKAVVDLLSIGKTVITKVTE